MYQASISATAPVRLVDRIAAALCRRPAALLLACLLLALAIRARQFGNPAIQVDEQFYLLVGDRMLHGALPFVDIWDRKPIGLFLLYAAIRAVSAGDGVLAYQLAATASAGATAFVLARIALRIARPAAALIVAGVYLLTLGVFGGDGGQSPVFYGLPVAIAGLMAVRAWVRPLFDARAIGWATGAIGLLGLAIQIKYTVVFEGAFFGLALLWRAHRAGQQWTSAAGLATLWLALALLPTAAAWGYYARIGQGEAFAYANFGSIFERGAAPSGSTAGRLAHIVAWLLPLGTAAVLGWRSRRHVGLASEAESAAAYRLIVGWAIAAILGVLVFGSYFEHYALPLIGPVALVAAPVLADRGTGIAIVRRGGRAVLPIGAIAIIVAAVGATVTINKNLRARGNGEQVRAIDDFLRPRLHDCLFVYAGEPILYHLTGSCLPTRWPFPDHLNNRSENASIGIDPLAEVARVMAGRPQFVVSEDHPEKKINQRTWSFMAAALARDYRPVFARKIGRYERIVYQRLPDRRVALAGATERR